MCRTAFLSVAALIVCTLSSARAAVIAADYRLQDIFESSVGAIGPLVPVGATTFVTFSDGTVDGQPQRVLHISTDMGAPAMDAGVRTQTNGFLSSTNYSLVLLANFDLNPVNLVATKIFDFKNLSSDAGLYVNSTDGTLAFIDGAGILQGTGGAAISALAFVQIVLTRDATTNLTSVYENGTLAFSFTDSAGLAILGDATPSGNSFLVTFKDDGMGLGGAILNEGSEGNIARLRLYDGVLSPSEVAALDRAIPEPGSFALCTVGMLALGIGAKGFRKRA